MARRDAAGDFIQFLIGGCLFGAGGFLLANQVLVHSDLGFNWWGTPGLGLLMLLLGIGVCLLFAGSHRRMANLLIWASLAALLVGVLNSLRMSLMPTTLWQLGAYVVMMAAGGGLMFRGLRAYDAQGGDGMAQEDLRREIYALRARLDQGSRG